MYGIFTYIYHEFKPNVGKYIPYMELLGLFTVKIRFFGVFPDLDPILNPKNQVILEARRDTSSKKYALFFLPMVPKVSLRPWFSASNSSTPSWKWIGNFLPGRRDF